MQAQAYGEAGVVKVIHILKREIVTGMRLLGARHVGELVPEMVSTLRHRLGLVLIRFSGYRSRKWIGSRPLLSCDHCAHSARFSRCNLFDLRDVLGLASTLQCFA